PTCRPDRAGPDPGIPTRGAVVRTVAAALAARMVRSRPRGAASTEATDATAPRIRAARGGRNRAASALPQGRGPQLHGPLRRSAATVPGPSARVAAGFAARRMAYAWTLEQVCPTRSHAPTYSRFRKAARRQDGLSVPGAAVV